MKDHHNREMNIFMKNCEFLIELNYYYYVIEKVDSFGSLDKATNDRYVRRISFLQDLFSKWNISDLLFKKRLLTIMAYLYVHGVLNYKFDKVDSKSSESPSSSWSSSTSDKSRSNKKENQNNSKIKKSKNFVFRKWSKQTIPEKFLKSSEDLLDAYNQAFLFILAPRLTHPNFVSSDEVWTAKGLQDYTVYHYTFISWNIMEFPDQDWIPSRLNKKKNN